MVDKNSNPPITAKGYKTAPNALSSLEAEYPVLDDDELYHTTEGLKIRPDAEDALTIFYDYLWSRSTKKKLEFPRSEIFYIRSLLNEKFGKDYSLTDVVVLLRETGLMR